jgi:RNA polymerase sigma factor (sigma-70 family)
MSAKPQDAGASWFDIFFPHASKLRQYVARRLRKTQDVDDVTQQVWLQLAQADPEAVRDPLGYVLGTARNVLNDLYSDAVATRGRFVASSDELRRAIEGLADPAMGNIADEVLLEHAIRRALKQLTKTHALVLRWYLQGLSYSEMALGLGLSPHTVGKYLVEIRAEIRMQWRE